MSRLTSEELAEVQRGLRMTNPPEAAQIRLEENRLGELEHASIPARTFGYLRFVGPGYMQSAMTLGGGTAAASLFSGALFGYTLLWVPLVAMLLGVIMLSAVSWQTLSTGMRPFDAMRRYAGAPFAWGWAIGALVSSIIWHFPQYALASGALHDIGVVAGVALAPEWMGVVVLVWAVAFSMMYGTSPTLVRWYERLLKYVVWGIVICFGWVVVRTGIDDWGAILRGFFTFRIPGEANGVAGTTVVLSGLTAAVGINMVFLYPYSLLARGWGRRHRRLARFDLLTSMLLPYLLATSLMIIATANTLHLDAGFTATRLAPVDAAQMLAPTVGETAGRIVMDVGLVAMALSTITLHMLCAGFVCSEIFGWPVGSWKYRLATLIPTPGVLGPVLWSKYAVWVAVPTNIVCGFLLPIAYVGFVILQRNRTYLRDDTPSGTKGRAWLGAMVLTTVFLTAYLLWYAVTKGPDWFESAF